jgi:hypothetical protein
MSDVREAMPALVVALAPSGTTVPQVKQFQAQIKTDWEEAKSRGTSLPSSIFKAKVRKRPTSSASE